jgi:hypothetical protein
VWYGTSILQGGVTVKVGNIETARVSLALNREVYNFGFSGNCHFDTAVAQFLVQIENPSLVIVDCMWNNAGPGIKAAATAFVTYLRSHGLPASTPVVLAEGLPFGRNWAVPADAAQLNAEGVIPGTDVRLVQVGAEEEEEEEEEDPSMKMAHTQLLPTERRFSRRREAENAHIVTPVDGAIVWYGMVSYYASTHRKWAAKNPQKKGE